jgi:NAD(P)H-flavin reductase
MVSSIHTTPVLAFGGSCSLIDYLHLTKRFGIVGASQLPFHYLLIWKSSWSPVQTLTRASHESLNAYHQLLGRVVTMLVGIHAALYFNFYVQNNLVASKLKEFYVLCGIVGIIAFAAIGTTALAALRRRSYRLFYVVHVVLATALVPVLFFHVHHIRIYLYETAAISAANILVRWLSATNLRGRIRSIPNTSLVEIVVSNDSSAASKRLAQDLRPGQHAYVSLAGKSFLHTFRSNPFTIASIPNTDGHIKFVARALNGNTKLLLSNAEKVSSDTKVNITVEGSYGLNTHEDRLLQYDRVLFVAGGVGATFIVPLYRQLLADLSPGKGSYRRQKVSFVWIARTKSEVTWAVPADLREKEGFAERLKICLTDPNTEGNGSTMRYDDNIEAAAVDENEDGIELEEQKQLLSNVAQSNGNGPADAKDLSIYAGRPDLRRLVHETLSHGGTERVAIVVCGPKTLSQSVRREVAPWVKRGREVWFHDESFSL